MLRELPCRVCEFLLLKLPCCMKRVRKSKELELCCIIFKTHAHCRFIHGFLLLPVPPQNVALILKLTAIDCKLN